MGGNVDCLLCMATGAFMSFEALNIALKRLISGHLSCFGCGIECSGLIYLMDHLDKCDSWCPVSDTLSLSNQESVFRNHEGSKCSVVPNVGEVSILCSSSKYVLLDQMMKDKAKIQRASSEAGNLKDMIEAHTATACSPCKTVDNLAFSNAHLAFSLTDDALVTEHFSLLLPNVSKDSLGTPKTSSVPYPSHTDFSLDFSSLFSDFDDTVAVEPSNDKLNSRESTECCIPVTNSFTTLNSNPVYTTSSDHSEKRSVNEQYLPSLDDLSSLSLLDNLILHSDTSTISYIPTTECVSLQHGMNTVKLVHSTSNASDRTVLRTMTASHTTSVSCLNTPLMAASSTTSTDGSPLNSFSFTNASIADVKLQPTDSFLYSTSNSSSRLCTSLHSKYSQAHLTESSNAINQFPLQFAPSSLCQPSSTTSPTLCFPLCCSNSTVASFEPATSPAVAASCRDTASSSSRRLRQILERPSQHACPRCPRRFRLLSSLQSHTERAHGSGDGERQSQGVRQSDGADLQCYVCKRCFTTPRRLQRHLDIVHGKKLTEAATGSLATQHQNDYVCSECGGTFSSAYFLREHSRLHTGERPHVCDICGKRFSLCQSLSRHRTYHEAERRHVCPECGRSFRELATLHNHRLVHAGLRPWQCEVCGKSFRQRVTYIVHRRLHTGELPYVCTLCGSAFRYKKKVHAWLIYLELTNFHRHHFDQFEKSQVQCSSRKCEYSYHVVGYCPNRFSSIGVC